MRTYKRGFISFIACCFVISLAPLVVSAQIPHPNTYVPRWTEIEKHKAYYDDPRPYLKEWGPKQVLPKELYEKLCYDEGKMKSLWTEVVGFRAPDVVGKIAPEIKPGKYTYQDLEKYPGLKQLMVPEYYKRIKPGGPPFTGDIPEFEIIPTRQYYWGLPIAEATQKNKGQTKLDKDGYMIKETWKGGYPFPMPSGPFKAQQVMYNLVNRYINWDRSYYIAGFADGYNKHLKRDFVGFIDGQFLKLGGRAMLPPYGWFDERAKAKSESHCMMARWLLPRDTAGMLVTAVYYIDPDTLDSLMAYIPGMRRVRKMTATDTQDPWAGQDMIYDDSEGWQQKLSKTRYPYKYEVIDEREYLVIAPTLDGAEYISSKGLERRNVRMERRPLYVIRLTQLDPNYVYGKRILYIDKETFVEYEMESYDQKGRLYRTWGTNWGFFPEMGNTSQSGGIHNFRDYVDLHSNIWCPWAIPAFYNRTDVSMESNIKLK